MTGGGQVGRLKLADPKAHLSLARSRHLEQTIQIERVDAA